MPAFLKKLTEQIYNSHKERLGEICIVLPNRRAILYIKNYLSGMLEKTSFLPEFYSIEDFVARGSGLVMTDPLRDQFSLYMLHRELKGEHARSMEEFFPYAAWMLSDFNEIDMYLVDRDQLYTFLSDAKAMALWNPDGRPLSDFEKQYLDFFRSIKQYYDGLNDLLSQKDMAYPGRAFRHLAEHIEEKAAGWSWDHLIFAGFNALTPAEEKIITYLLKAGKADLFWDADKYYVNDPVQEAGYFMRKYFKTLDREEPRWLEDHFSGQKDIHVIGVPQNIGQLKYAGEILSKLAEEKGSLDHTALVLSDESLLLPMLNSIPERAGKFNVTMGMALKHTPLYSLLDTILSMHRSADSFSRMRNTDQRSFYSKDLIRLVSHPWFGMLLPADRQEFITDMGDRIRASNRIFFPYGQIKALFDEADALMLEALFPSKTDPGSMQAALSSLMLLLRQRFIGLRENGKKDYGLELEFIFRFGSLMQRLQGLIQDYGTITSMKTLQMVFRQLSQQERIAFRGEPLEGLQVMGMLETRTLDFETVIMISVNEGTLPASKMPNSFIPYDIKEQFGLPTYRHNNAVFAYHFYRLMQRAKDVYLLYNTEAGALGGGEKSRFITQLQHEGPKYNPGLSITEQLLSMPPQPGSRNTAIVIEKKGEVIQLLKEEAEKGFHPSSLNKYIDCPLQFYLSRLVKVEEADELEETIDARTLGIVIHETLRFLLEQHLDKPLDKAVFDHLKKQIDQEVARQFRKFYHDDDISYGKNFLIVSVARHMLRQLFEREADWLADGREVVLTGLEKGLSTVLETEKIGRIRFKGNIDRIDQSGHMARILDYKTGGVNPAKLKPGSWDEMFTNPENSQAFQLMMYAWLYDKNHPGDAGLSAGVISLRAPGKGPAMFKPPGADAIDTGVLETFENELVKLMTRIFDPGVPFVQTEDETRCKYCSFKEICNRSLSKNEY